MIKRIFIEKLFGVFTHEILLENDITIIHGLNGCGKTTVLRIIDFLFSQKTDQLSQIEFDRIEMELTGNRVLEIKRELFSSDDSINEKSKYIERLKGGRSHYLTFRLSLPDGSIFESPTKETTEAFISNFTSGTAVFQKKSSFYAYLNEFSTEQLDSYLDHAFVNEKLNERYYGLFSNLAKESHKNFEISEPISKVLEEMNVKFISADRLKVQTSKKSSSYGENSIAIEDRVSIFANQIAEDIKKTFQEYGDFTERTDRTFPYRVLKEKNVLSEQDIISKMKSLEDRRRHYVNIGILDAEPDAIITELSSISITDQDRRTLSLYVQDNEKKLDVIERLSKRISLFKDILDRKYENKEIIFDKQKGFTFRLKQSSVELLGSQLSSGEQQELVLLYDLVFNTNDKTLVLIDEPELSLHIKWQLEFIDDMLEIIKENSFNVLIATHSPQIIDKRWDLTVLLK